MSCSFKELSHFCSHSPAYIIHIDYISSFFSSHIDKLSSKVLQCMQTMYVLNVAGKSSKSGGWEKEWKFEFGGGGGKRNNPFATGGGSGGDGRPNQQLVTGVALAASIAGLLMLSRSSSYREISWKEFVNDYLARGTVENLTVVNNKWVKIKTRTDSVETVKTILFQRQ